MLGDANAFDFVGDGEIGVVAIHGFTGTPYEMRYLGEQLARGGMSVCGLRLPGHGTTWEDLETRTWREWAAAVDAAVDQLARSCHRVALVGQSLGGLLALHVAAHRRDLACVASLAAPLWLAGIAERAAQWCLRLGIRTLPKVGGSDVRDRRIKHANPAYPRVPVRALGELLDFMRVVDAELPLITQPVLVLHAANDHTAPVACAARIAEQTRAARVRILPRSFHLIATDVERDIVAAEVTSFVRGAKSCVT